MTWFTPEYLAYLESAEWHTLRQRKLAQAGYKCQNCGSRRRDRGSWLEVNHLTYDRLFRERLSDLNVLCNGPESKHCHDRYTARTRARRRKKFSLRELIFG